LLRVINRLIEPETGDIRIAGRPVDGDKQDPARVVRDFLDRINKL
jgi:ABC-type proline/glycine betaine transport system ATPase subunit